MKNSQLSTLNSQSIKERAERAKAYFQDGYNCSQSVFMAYADLFEDYTANGAEYVIYDGDMISEIDGLVQDDVAWTVYWACYYNGEYATVGLWGYVPAEGDLIEIKYEESTWES